MEFVKLDFKDLSSIKCEYYATPKPSFRLLKVLVVKFTGECGYGSGCDDDAAYMSAMIAAGFKAWSFSGLILDLSELKYEWGDMMDLVAYPPEIIRGDCPIFPFAIVVSDLNLKGLTSLMEKELGEDPKEFLFETFDEAVNKVEGLLKK